MIRISSLFVLIWFTTCMLHAAGETRTDSLFRPDKSLRETAEMSQDGTGKSFLHGKRSFFDERGRKTSEREYRMGMKEGYYRIWHPGGELFYEIFYHRNRAEGNERSWSAKGVLLSSVQYKWGKEHGRSLHFYRDGSPKEECSMVYGKKHGKCFLWFAGGEGKRLAETNWKNGEKEGWSRNWDSTGVLRKEVRWRGGKKNGRSRSWNSTAQLESEKRLRDDRKNGLERHRLEDGGLRETFWKNGKRHGKEIFLSPSGVKVRELHWKQDLQEGRARRWDETSTLRQESSYVAGVLHGWFKEWAPDGSLLTRTLYMDGEIEQVVGAVETFFVPLIPPPALRRELVGNVEKSYNAEGELITETEMQDGKNHGIHRLYKKGVLILSITYRMDKLHGNSRLYWPSGKVRQNIPYVDEKIQGLVQTWYPGGEAESEFSYVDDLRQGTAQGWYIDGKKQFEMGWRKGFRHGIARTWFPSGELKSETGWNRGWRHGVSVRWRKDGSEITRSKYEWGDCTGGNCGISDQEGVDSELGIQKSTQ